MCAPVSWPCSRMPASERLGVFFVDSGGDFQTMADSLALYGETGAAAKAAGRYAEPKLRRRRRHASRQRPRRSARSPRR